MLGMTQERWLGAQLAADQARWSLIGQQTLVSGLRLAGEGDPVWPDFWDAAPAARARLIGQLRGVRNPVVLGGDLHSFWLCDVHGDARRRAGAPVATEVVTTRLASRNGPQEVFGPALPLNPHVRWMDNGHAGYALLEVTADAVQGDLRAVSDRADPQGSVSSLQRFAIEAGAPGVRVG